MLATVLGLTALAMALAGTVSVLVQRAAAIDRTDRAIARHVAEFRTLAMAGTGPGRPFTDVGSLLQAALQRQVPAVDETYLGMVDGRPTWIPSGPRPVRLEAGPAIVAAVARLPADTPVRIRDAMTGAGEVRYAAVQVRVGGQPQAGSYVVAMTTAPGQRVILSDAGTGAAGHRAPLR